MKKHHTGRHGFQNLANEKDNEPAVNKLEEAARSWEQTWSIISSRTGIMEPEAFFQRVENGCAALFFL